MKSKTRRNCSFAALAVIMALLYFAFSPFAERQGRADSAGISESGPNRKGELVLNPGASGSDRRKMQVSTQAAVKVNSLLSIRPGEVAVIGIPAGAADEWLGSTSPDQLLPLARVRSALMGMVEQGLSIKAKVGNEIEMEFAGESSSVKIEVVEDHPNYVVFRIRYFVDGSMKVQSSATVYKGYSVMLRTRDAEGFLILVGSAAVPEP